MKPLTAAMIAVQQHKDELRGAAGENGTDGRAGDPGPIGPAGATGPVGPKGLRGEAGADGEPGLVWRGPYRLTENYAPPDVVEYQGSSYVSLSPSIGVRPPASVWELVAKKGDAGPAGVAGSRGGGGGVALSNAVPLVESGSGAPGSGTKASKDDHVHPADGGGGGGSDDQTAAEVPFTPVGGIAATDVQAAIEEVAAEAGGALLGPPTTVEIAAGTIDATGLHYILLDGEGEADDQLDEITGGVDGQLLLIEEGPAGNEITILPNSADNLSLVDLEANSVTLGGFVTQILAFYSAAVGRWLLWSNQRPSSIMSDDGNTEILADSTSLQAMVAGAPAFTAFVTAFTVYARPLVLDGALTPIADGDLAPSDVSFHFDDTNGAASPMWKGKSADGTVVSGSLGGSGAAAVDPGDIADPTLATAETVALKLNALMAAMRIAGSLA